MNITRVSRHVKYLTAPAATGAAAALTLLFSDHGLAAAPFLLFFAAVVASAWIGGWQQGAIAALLSAFATNWLFIEPRFSLEGGSLRLVIFSIEATAIGWLIHTLRISRKAAEVRASELQQAYALLENLVETVPSATVATDEQGRIFLFNRSAELLTGYSRTEVIGQPLLDLFVPPAWQQQVSLRFDPAQKASVREPHRNPWKMKDGSERLIEFRCAILETPTGIRILGVGNDVTDIAALEQQQTLSVASEKEARCRAEEANRTKDYFLATVSHELRSPLTSIAGWVQLLRMIPDDPEMLDRGLTAITESARAQTRLVDDLLDLSRAYAGKLAISREPLDLEPVVQSAVELIVPEAQSKAIELRTTIAAAPSPLRIDGDRDRLRQILLNVLQNALRYTDTGYVEVRVERIDSHAEIIVSDTGRGIRAEFLPYIFEAFTRETRNETELPTLGVGVGLAVVKSLVELHGGSISAESDGAGKGSTFRLRLPLLASAVEA